MTENELKRYIPLKREAEELKERYERLEDEAKSVKAMAIDGMPRGTSSSDSIGNIVVKLEMLRQEYLTKYDLALCELYKIERFIDTIKDITERRILRKRYIEGKTWEEVSDEMPYCIQHTQRIKKKIINKICD